MLLSIFRHCFTVAAEIFREVLELWYPVFNRHDGAFVVHMDGVLEIEVLNYRDFGTSRSVTDDGSVYE